MQDFYLAVTSGFRKFPGAKRSELTSGKIRRSASGWVFSLPAESSVSADSRHVPHRQEKLTLIVTGAGGLQELVQVS